MNAARTARERAREQLTAEIAATAHEHLRTVGAPALSLRAVARDLGLASSAIYRYFPSRDALLTHLVTDAYVSVGEVVQTADSEGQTLGLSPRARLIQVGHSLRQWAIANPHQYALVYGSPVPGYSAPETTIATAARTTGTIVRLAALGTAAEAPVPTGELGHQINAIKAALGLDVSPTCIALAVAACTQLFGLISFELFGQFNRTLEPAGDFFAYTLDRIADQLGL